MGCLDKIEQRVDKKRVYDVRSASKRWGNCLEGNIINKKEDYKSIEICGFDYKLFEEEEGGGF